MIAYELSHPGLENLHRIELPEPKVKAGCVVVRMRAASLNFIDLAVARNQYPGIVFPIVPVSDGAGEIAEIGPDVDGWSVGDRVIPHFKPSWISGPITATANALMRGVTMSGSLAELVVVPAASLVRTPSHLTDVEAATLPVAATTAWNAVRTGGVQPGSTVLLLGTGGVSIFALQLAKAAGARVIITSSSHAKLAMAKSRGADEIISYRENEQWQDEVLRLTEGAGVDLVVETGGSATFAKSLSATSFGGTVFTIGFVTGPELQFNVLPLISKSLRVQGNNTGSVADLRSVAGAITALGLHPVLHKVFDWTEARAAYETLTGGEHFGKVVIELRG